MENPKRPANLVAQPSEKALPAQPPFRPRLAIIGLGGIGASIGLASQTFASHRVGYDIDPDARAGALSIGAIDQPVETLAECAQADLIVIAVPPLAIPTVLQSLADHLSVQTVLTDTASIKQPILGWVRLYLPYPQRFVGGHPIAGTEQSGWKSARPDLFQSAQWVLTPLSGGTDPDALDCVQALLKAIGATSLLMDSEQHDAELALLSHLPHVLAFCLSDLHQHNPTALSGGSSWHSATRVAQSDPTLWAQIFSLNRKQVLETLHQFRTHLDQLTQLLEQGDSEAIEAFLRRARKRRDSSLGSDLQAKP